VAVILAACRATSTERPTVQGATAVNHQEGDLSCLAAEVAKGDLLHDRRAVRLRQMTVTSLLQDTLARGGQAHAPAPRWCVVTSTPGWRAPPGVTALPMPPIEELGRRSGCRSLEVDPANDGWERCSYRGKTVEAISFVVRWWPDKDDQSAARTSTRLFVYGAFFEDEARGLVKVIRTMSSE
jgi:hypothetical protein